MFSRLKQFFKKGSRTRQVEPGIENDPELSWLIPPSDPRDADAWDHYWREHMAHGLGPPLFDMFCDDRQLVEVMQDRGMRTVLCAGNGISQEPKALAEAGFEVCVLDSSIEAINIAKSFEFPPGAFEHYCDLDSRRPDGSVEFLVGDIFDSSVFPGPFDVIIERRTAQIFPPPDLARALNALAHRLAANGIFLSHSHDGAWKPPGKPRHFTASWFKDNGWTVWAEGRGTPPSGRAAWLQTTTG